MIDVPKLARREWDALGALLLPPKLGGKTRLGPKTGPKLRELGLVEEAEMTIEPEPGQPAWTRVKWKGWRLTQLGQITYCEWAGRQLLAMFGAPEEE